LKAHFKVDLWSGNASRNEETGQPVIFDPCAYYAHNVRSFHTRSPVFTSRRQEMELGMMRLFGGFTKACFDAYHQVIPRMEPHYEERQQLYLLYHQLNHVYLFGGDGYRNGAKTTMQNLLAFAERAHLSKA
jgi:protein-ribulosamine 3-kinase